MMKSVFSLRNGVKVETRFLHFTLSEYVSYICHYELGQFRKRCIEPYINEICKEYFISVFNVILLKSVQGLIEVQPMTKEGFQHSACEGENDEIKPNSLAGIYADIATHLGVDVATKMHELYGGQQISFPIRLQDGNYISSRIKEEYLAGEQIRILSKKYHYSERRIRQILKEIE